MKSITKKIVICSLIGITQFALSTTVIEASPLFNGGPQKVQLNSDHHDDQRDREKQKEHDRRLEEENKRHEKEIQRRKGESEQAWHERREKENQRHENATREIAALLIGVAIGTVIN